MGVRGVQWEGLDISLRPPTFPYIKVKETSHQRHVTEVDLIKRKKTCALWWICSAAHEPGLCIKPLHPPVGESWNEQPAGLGVGDLSRTDVDRVEAAVGKSPYISSTTQAGPIPSLNLCLDQFACQFSQPISRGCSPEITCESLDAMTPVPKVPSRSGPLVRRS